MLAPTIRPRRCKAKSCREQFTPTRPLQCVCSHGCALALVADKRAKADRVATKQARERLKTRRQWLDEAQAAFNRWVRLRDEGLPCISCGRHHQGAWDAGHYLSTGARPELRFEPDNCHRQCVPCNQHKGGNIVLYRQSLLVKIGADRLAWLEGPHQAQKWTVDQLREIRDGYRRLARELERERPAA